MTYTTRLKKLEVRKPEPASPDAKLKLEKHLQRIAGRRPSISPAEEQASSNWFKADWPRILQEFWRTMGNKA